MQNRQQIFVKIADKSIKSVLNLTYWLQESFELNPKLRIGMVTYIENFELSPILNQIFEIFKGIITTNMLEKW